MSTKNKTTGSFERGLKKWSDLRDWYAGLAMQALLSNPANYTADGDWREAHESVAESAYGIADDMMEQRSKVSN